jgi:signal peptidase I
MRAAIWAGLGAVVLVVGIVARQMAWVPDTEMTPSYLPGDLVVILPLPAAEGDVVAVSDPLEPARWTLRRVEAIGGAVRYDGNVFRSSSRPKVRTLDMGEYAGDAIFLEGEHLVSRRASPPTRARTDDVGVPDDAAFVSADARDRALDSRWWGPVPLDEVHGVVVARIGVPTTPWRGWFGGRGESVVIPKSTTARPG